MSNSLLKKVTAAVALTAIVSSTIGSVSSTYASTAELEAAAKLADAGVITTASDYRLGDTITRREMLKVMVNLADLTVENKCEGKFTDLPATDWGCKYAEAALAAGYIAANAKFRPNDNVSKAEAVKMVMKAKGLEKDATAGLSWEAAYVKAAVAANLVDAAFTDYSTASKRGFTIVTAANAIDSEEDDMGLDDLLGGDDTTSTGNTTTDGNTTTVVKSGDLEVSLAASTPAASELSQDAKGVSVLSFDLTAGSTDVSVDGVELERTGFASSEAKTVALFVDGVRTSKVDDFGTSDDKANLVFSPALVVKAGSTVTLTAKVNVDTDGNVGQFAVKVNSLSTSAANVEMDSIVSSTFETKAVAATKLEISNEGVTNKVKAGEQQAELAKIKISNEGTASSSTDVDASVNSITLKEMGGIDENSEIGNLTLTVDGKVVSTVASISGKYVTFNFDSIVIEEDKNKIFTVKADILGGAGENVQFKLDSLLDVSATATRYNSVNVALKSTFTTSLFTDVSIEAGELTIYAIDAVTDEVRADRDNVELGKFKLVNVAGQNLQLRDLFIKAVKTGGNAAEKLVDVLDNVELVSSNGSSYALDPTNVDAIDAANDDSNTDTDLSAYYGDTALDITLPQGETIFTIRADIKKDVDTGAKIKLDLLSNETGTDAFSYLVIEETEDDVEVTDITPNSLSWKLVEVKDSSATASNVNLANVEVVKGAADVVALQYEIEAGKTSYLTTDEVKVAIKRTTGQTANIAAPDSATITTNATKNEVSAVKLYVDSVSAANLLETKSGNDLVSGVVTFDGFSDVKINADSTRTFIVTVSFVDTDSVDLGYEAFKVSVDASTIKLEDDETDPVVVTGTLSDKVIEVLPSGTLAMTADKNDNEDKITILAGNTTATTVFSTDIKSDNEVVDAEEVVFTLDKNLKSVVKTASLMLGTTEIKSVGTSKVVDTTAVTAVKAVKTITFAGDLVALNSVAVSVDGTPLAATVFDTDNDTTIANLATALAATAGIDTAVVTQNGTNDHVITLTATTAGTDFTVTTPVVTLGASQTTATVATTTANVVAVAAKSVITFDKLTTFKVPTAQTELKLALVTEPTGKDNLGEAVSAVKVTNVAINTAEGDVSGEDVTVTALSTTESNTFSVVPVSVIAAANSTFGQGDNVSTLTFAVDAGSNKDSAGNVLTAGLKTIKVNVSSYQAAGTITVKNSNGVTISAATAVSGAGDVTIIIDSDGTIGAPSTADNISNGEVYTIETTAEATFTLAKDGVVYTVDSSDYTMELKNAQSMGTYDKNN